MSRFIKEFDRFAIVPNTAVRDKRLSLSTLGLWAFLCNLPNDWHYSVRGLATAKGCGVRAISSALKALEEYGYLKRIQCRDGNKFAGVDYLLVANPSEDNDAQMSCTHNVYTENSEHAQIASRESERNIIPTNSKPKNIITNNAPQRGNDEQDILEMMRKRSLLHG